MKALFFGSKSWGDSYMMDLLIGGLKDSNKGFPKEQVQVMVYDSDHEGAAQRARVAADSNRHPGTFLVPPDGTPNMVFVLHDGLPQDSDCLDRIRHWERQGVPVYHIRHMDRATIGRLWSAAQRRKVGSAPVGPERKRRRGGARNGMG